LPVSRKETPGEQENDPMTRIPSLIVASTLALLPIGAFAQTSAAPAKDAAPASMTTPAPAADPGKNAGTATSAVIQAAKPGVKAEGHGVVSSHHAKTTAPAKTAEPSKS
jgi:hypothetical protein